MPHRLKTKNFNNYNNSRMLHSSAFHIQSVEPANIIFQIEELRNYNRQPKSATVQKINGANFLHFSHRWLEGINSKQTICV